MDNKGQPPPPYPGEPSHGGGGAPYGSAYPAPPPMPSVTTTTYYQGATSAHIVPGNSNLCYYHSIILSHFRTNSSHCTWRCSMSSVSGE